MLQLLSSVYFLVILAASIATLKLVLGNEAAMIVQALGLRAPSALPPLPPRIAPVRGAVVRIRQQARPGTGTASASGLRAAA